MRVSRMGVGWGGVGEYTVGIENVNGGGGDNFKASAGHLEGRGSRMNYDSLINVLKRLMEKEIE